MKVSFSQRIILLYGVMFTLASSAEPDTRTVQAEFDRCKGTLDRVDRSVERFQDAVRNLKRYGMSEPRNFTDSISKEISNLESRLEYFRSRSARAAGQADKIRDELKSVKGPTCPSCVTSSVQLYCRYGETLSAEIDEYLARTSELQQRLIAHDMKKGPTGQREKNGGFVNHRVMLDSAIALKKIFLDSCVNHAGKTLWEQCVVTLHKADSLHACGAVSTAEKTVEIAKILFEKAVAKCEGK